MVKYRYIPVGDRSSQEDEVTRSPENQFVKFDPMPLNIISRVELGKVTVNRI